MKTQILAISLKGNFLFLILTNLWLVGIVFKPVKELLYKILAVVKNFKIMRNCSRSLMRKPVSGVSDQV